MSSTFHRRVERVSLFQRHVFIIETRDGSVGTRASAWVETDAQAEAWALNWMADNVPHAKRVQGPAGPMWLWEVEP